MRIVVDANVLVAALLSPHSPPAAILRLIVCDRVTVCCDARILDEYRTVIERPTFAFDPRMARELLAYLKATGELINAPPLALKLPDPDDAMFVEVAMAGRADYLISGNLKHFPVRECRGVCLVSSREFIEQAAL